MIKIGKIVNTHGIKGEVKIINLSDFNRFVKDKEIYVLYKNEKMVFKIENVRKSKTTLIVKFYDFNNINEVLMYKGLDLYSDESLKNELEEDEYHYDDLIDKKIYDTNGNLLGVTTSVLEVPQGHLLEVLTNENKKALVPFRSVFIKEILEDKIILDPIEGLL